MRPAPPVERPLRGESGMASVALFIFAMVSLLVLITNFTVDCAMSATSDAYDSFTSQLVEKNGLAQVVKESVLAIGETAAAPSANPLQVEIRNRLSSFSFPPGVSVTLDASAPLPAVPANPFFPSTPAAAQVPDFFAGAGIRPIAGMGNLLGSLCRLGPVSDLGRLTVRFDRTSSTSPQDNRAYTVNADLFSVPLTNVDVVAYGLPITGAIPPSAPPVPPGFFGADVSRLVVTSNSPANDPTACGDLWSSSGTERLPYQFRNAVSFAWTAYEFLWSSGYQDTLLGEASLEGNLANFSSPPAQPVPGVTVSGTTATVDCASVTGPIVAIVDPAGGGTVNVTGSAAAAGGPFILLVRNTAGVQTQVNFTGDNARPGIFYLENAAVRFSGNPQVQGAIFLDPLTSASGSVTLFGHLSFYGAASPLAALSVTMADSPAVKAALVSVAPRVLLVSTTATR